MAQAISPATETDTPIVTRDQRTLGGALIVAKQRFPLPFVISVGDPPEGHRGAQTIYPTLSLAQIEAAFARLPFSRERPERTCDRLA